MIANSTNVENVENGQRSFEDQIRSEYANGEFQFSLKKYYDLHNEQCIANGMPEEVIKSNFRDWVRNLFDGADFEEGFSFAKILAKPTSKNGGRPSADYVCTADMIKEVGMLTKTKVGSAVRKAFIQIEKKYKLAQSVGVIDPQTDALISAMISGDQVQLGRFVRQLVSHAKVVEAQLIMTEDEFDKYKEKFEGVVTRAEYAKILQGKGYNVATKRCSRANVSDILDGVLTEYSEEYRCEIARQDAIDNGYAINVKKRTMISGHKCITAYITPKGQRYYEQFFSHCKTQVQLLIS